LRLAERYEQLRTPTLGTIIRRWRGPQLPARAPQWWSSWRSARVGGISADSRSRSPRRCGAG